MEGYGIKRSDKKKTISLAARCASRIHLFWSVHVDTILIRLGI